MKREDREPTRRPGPGGGVPLGLLLGGGGALLALVIGGIILAIWLMSGGSTTPTAPVTAADLDKISIYMTPDEVQGAIGAGRVVDVSQVPAAWGAAGTQAGATKWYQWQNGGDELYVGFGQGSSGTERAVISFFVHNVTVAQGVGQETKRGFHHINLFQGDLDVAAAEKAKERALLKSPRWKKGPAIREALVGTWVAIYVGSYTFNADGTCRADSPGGRAGGTYRFLDEDNVELTIKDDPLFKGHETVARTRKYQVLVDEAELILVMEGLREASPTVYKRQK